jgi:N-acetylmuramoyl-L-alanine amidase
MGAVKLSAWDEALAARQSFEAEPAGEHTKAEYAAVMDNFRTIYHDDPAAAHAGRAVEQVAELLAEQGKELGDKKSLRDAAGQYEFLARAYPGGSLAAEALTKALDLLGPGEADDPLEAKKVKMQLELVYPKYAKVSEARTAPAQAGVSPQEAPAPIVRPPAQVEPVVEKATAPLSLGPAAVVTGIRHWSTASYTRVAIDLAVDSNDEVKYQAARVENPDRIFFDLHHAKLAPQLAGKSFSVTDDGFLTRIRAAQYTDDVTRVVLDVHEVAEYSAFLLPNPYRLIIDIHGKPNATGGEQAAANPEPTPAPSAQIPQHDTVAPRPSAGGTAEVSSLPPMPVTDGSAGFGLPPKSAAAKVVAQPRVVVSSKPTVAKPVPNTVTRSSIETGNEVAAVSNQPGKIEATRAPTSQPIASDDHYVPRSKRTVLATGDAVTVPISPKSNAGHPALSQPGMPVEAAPPTADGETSLVRALGLKIGRIVIDAGHGGHDSGTLGAGGIEEKDVVLDVALRLGKLLHDRLGAEIVYTRADDTFIPLETRTAIANKAQADLFISVHANSSQDETARGVEVYYLNFTSDPDAMRVASRENAVSTQSVHELSDLVKKITMKDKIDESRELASDVDTSLFAGLTKGNPGLKNRGVKKAPFVVLIGANMPSILAEISFVTNPDDAEQLRTPAYRERVAESLYGGVAKYAAGINGMKPRTAKSVDRAER